MKRITHLLIVLIFLVGCSSQPVLKIIVTNNDVDRTHETIEIKSSELKAAAPDLGLNEVQIFDKDNTIITSQKIDENLDGKIDLIIFQTNLKTNETQTFLLKSANAPDIKSKTFARFVPEREKDFAWENDRIAFRMYSQKLAEKENVDSGIDVWVKSVDHLVIDKWYKGADYHTDHGEGLDFYKVGPSRGCGGLAFLVDKKLQPTGGYVDYKMITNGPIRSEFELSYSPYEIDGEKYQETRRISIDAGWNLNKIQSTIATENSLPVAIGLKMQADPAKAAVNSEKGFITLWENITDEIGSLGQAVVINRAKDRGRDIINNHHLLITEFGKDNSIDYYAGAGWSKSLQFDNQEDWLKYIENIAHRINHPITIRIEK